jgi:hypothetical protein
MSKTTEIGRISMVVECDGKPCAVILPQDQMRLLVNLAASLSDTGVLPVRALGSEYHFETLVTQ